MKLLVDAQLSPSIAAWINRTFDTIEAESVWALGLKAKSDQDVYSFAKQYGYVIMSKDSDFLDILK